MITLLHEQHETELPAARASGEALWLERADIERATGWTWKPEGLCRDEVCVPLPRGREGALTAGDRLDIAGMWRHMGHPVVRDQAGEAWVLGTGAAERSATLQSLQAPDFALPDLDGRTHRLSEHRGR